jgi:hypothetical protein
MTMLRWARWWHGATFVVGLFGLAVQVWVILAHPQPYDGYLFATPIRIWNLLSYFTIWSNILVAALAWLLLRNPQRAGSVFGVFRLASLVMITVTGVIYAIVLAPLWKPTGWAKVADQTLHYAVPILAVLGYLLFGPRPASSLGTALRSLVIPLAWAGYTMIRSPFIGYPKDGHTKHWWPYHFINVDDLGYGMVLLTMVGVAILLLGIGGIYLQLDRRLPPRPTRTAP